MKLRALLATAVLAAGLFSAAPAIGKTRTAPLNPVNQCSHASMEFWADTERRGAYLLLCSDTTGYLRIDNLGYFDFNDRASSIRFYLYRNSYVCFYRDNNRGGGWYSNISGLYGINNWYLYSIGRANDQISSFEINPFASRCNGSPI